MTVYEAVVSRWPCWATPVTDNDETGLNFLIDKCEKDILADINQRVLPDGPFLCPCGYGGRAIPL